jgi:hypothetical protein
VGLLTKTLTRPWAGFLAGTHGLGRALASSTQDIETDTSPSPNEFPTLLPVSDGIRFAYHGWYIFLHAHGFLQLLAKNRVSSLPGNKRRMSVLPNHVKVETVLSPQP